MVKPGIEIALYLAAHFRKRNGNLHEFTNIYLILHLRKRDKNFVLGTFEKCTL
jgi:hypothetical protein